MTMSNEEIKLQCHEQAGNDLELAKVLYAWVVGAEAEPKAKASGYTYTPLKVDVKLSPELRAELERIMKAAPSMPVEATDTALKGDVKVSPWTMKPGEEIALRLLSKVVKRAAKGFDLETVYVLQEDWPQNARSFVLLLAGHVPQFLRELEGSLATAAVPIWPRASRKARLIRPASVDERWSLVFDDVGDSAACYCFPLQPVEGSDGRVFESRPDLVKVHRPSAAKGFDASLEKCASAGGGAAEAVAPQKEVVPLKQVLIAPTKAELGQPTERINMQLTEIRTQGNLPVVYVFRTNSSAWDEIHLRQEVGGNLCLLTPGAVVVADLYKREGSSDPYRPWRLDIGSAFGTFDLRATELLGVDALTNGNDY